MVLLRMNPETGRQQRENFTKPKWKNYDFTMFLSRITASHGIAVKWYLRVYWLLPFSIVDSFAEHRWILGPVNQLHFPKESFPYFNGLFFSSSTEIVDSLARRSYWINRHLPQDPPDFCLTKRSCQRYGTQVFFGPCQDMFLRYWRTGINET